jgi:RNA polymerase sigma-70 factor (ECF subfamily)
VQETLLAAFRWRMSFKLDRNFRTWLWTILLNQCHRDYKRRTRGAETVSLVGPVHSNDQAQPLDPLCRAPSPLENILAKERAELVDQLLTRLPLPQADALRLRFFAGLKFQEIADTMGCSLPTAKNRVRWGLARMAGWIAQSTENMQTPKGRGEKS